MKSFITNTVYLIGLMFITYNSFGQIQKGKWISSAAIDVNVNDGKLSSPNQTEKTSSIDFSIEQGYFVSSNVTIGIGGNFLSRKRNTIRESGSYVKDKSSNIGFFVYCQFFKKIAGKFSYSPSLSLNYSKDKGRSEEKDPNFSPVISTYNINNYGIRINPAQSTFSLTKKVLLECGFGYLIIGKRSGTTVYPLETVIGSSTAFKMNFSPFITNIKISLLF